MKKLRLIFILLFAYALGFGQGFYVDSFSADIYLHKEGYFDVVERYNVNFTEEKHGLLRNVITKFDFKDEDDQITKRKIYLTNIEVPDHHFAVTSGLLANQNANLTIKIGSALKKVSGVQHYEIRYRVSNALIFTPDQVMLYWNVKPPNWEANFDRIQYTVHTPEGIHIDASQCFTYSGPVGNSQLSRDFEYDFSDTTYIAESYTSSGQGESVTTLVRLPKKAIAEPSSSDLRNAKLAQFSEKYQWVYWLLGFAALVFLMIRRAFGKKKKVIPVTSYYAPDGIDASVAGYLIDNTGDNRDLMALLPKWGNEGLIRIDDLPKKSRWSSADVQISKLKELPEGRPLYEEILFKGLFQGEDFTKTLHKKAADFTKEDKGLATYATLKTQYFTARETVNTSDLKNSFYKVMSVCQSILKLKTGQYYDKNLEKKGQALGCFTMLLSVAIAGLLYLIYASTGIAMISFFSFLVLSFLVFYLATRKNKEGNEIYAQLLGFKKFIELAEVQRIKKLLEEDPHYFEKTMPYAVAFNLLEKWAGKFEALGVPPPSWYGSSSMSSLGSAGFAHSLSQSIHAAQSNMVTSPSGSSGGSSGGGAGGGGGGSW